jgi:hypothetical protein
MIRFLIISSLLIFCFSCKKENKKNPEIISGNAEVVGHVMHHTWAIPGIKVYVKANAATFPGPDPNVYDSWQIADANGYVGFNGLGSGPHYFYAVGYDPVQMDSVTGSYPLNIELRPGEFKDYNIVIPVSE